MDAATLSSSRYKTQLRRCEVSIVNIKLILPSNCSMTCPVPVRRGLPWTSPDFAEAPGLRSCEAPSLRATGLPGCRCPTIAQPTFPHRFSEASLTGGLQGPRVIPDPRSPGCRQHSANAPPSPHLRPADGSIGPSSDPFGGPHRTFVGPLQIFVGPQDLVGP